MFERIVFTDIPHRAARRGLYALLASVMQGVLFGGALFASAHAGTRDGDEMPTVEVRFVSGLRARTAARPGAPRAARPPGLAAAARKGGGGGGAPRAKPPPPAALVQPREVNAAIRMPGPGEPGEELPAGAWGDDEEGVVGGDVGEPVFEETPAPPAAPEIEEAPRWFSAGFRRPVEREPGCIGASIRLPADLAGFVADRMTVKFAVGRDGRVGAVEFLSDLPDRRIAAAIEAALRACPWQPGSDASGQAITLWVILPLRFQGN